jgi:WD40 repeat protein
MKQNRIIATKPSIRFFILTLFITSLACSAPFKWITQNVHTAGNRQDATSESGGPNNSFTPIPIKITTQCIDIQPQIQPSDQLHKGTLVFNLGGTGTSYFLDLKDEKKYPFPALPDSASIFGAQFSPDGSWLAVAWQKQEQAQLWLINPQGKVEKSFDWDQHWIGFRWLDNNRLEVTPDTRFTGDMIVVDLARREWQSVAPKFPDMFTDFQTTQPSWFVQYSPNLQWVIYLRRPLDVSVWDLTTQRVIWDHSNPGIFNQNGPQWSPKGDQIAVEAEGQLFHITRDGGGRSLPLIVNQDSNGIYEFNWSPDSRYLAYWTWLKGKTTAKLILFDSQTNQLMDDCIETNAINKLPTWSPDGKQFIIVLDKLDTQNKHQFRTVLFDIAKQTAFQLPEERSPWGWMK